MKRQEFLKTVGLFPLVTLIACEKGLPLTPTIVIGKIIDEGGLPVEGVAFALMGMDSSSGLFPKKHEIFREQTKTDGQGKFRFEMIFPSNTSSVDLLADPDGYLPILEDIYVFRDGAYQGAESVPVLRRDYGQTINYDFQLRKK